MDNKFGADDRQMVTVCWGSHTQVFHVTAWDVIDGHLILHAEDCSATVIKKWDNFVTEPEKR